LRSVVVTGGSRGIGLGIAERLALAGFRVVAVARSEGEALAAARCRVHQAGRGRLEFRAFDLAGIAEIPAFVRELRHEFGPPYGLVNNAGIGTSGLLATMPDDAIARLVQINMVAAMTLTKYLLRSMMTACGGRIVNLSSVVSETGYTGLSVYAATKASMLGFTRSLAREVGPLGITVNAVSPGFVETEMTHGLTPPQRERIMRRSALRRMPEVVDVAAAVEFLFSDGARNITGTVTTVDAGNTA
jgi:3-oxoacyl-[acyl-carrier protein] reductase